MNYNINLNQYALMELPVRISPDAAIILTAMLTKKSLSQYAAKKVVHNGNEYFWFKHTEVFNAVPFIFPIGCTEKAMKLRIIRATAELEAAGLLRKLEGATVMQMSYYHFTLLAETLIHTSLKNEVGTFSRTSLKNDRVPTSKMIEQKVKTSLKNEVHSIESEKEVLKSKENEKNALTFSKSENKVTSLETSTLSKQEEKKETTGGDFFDINAKRHFKDKVEMSADLFKMWKGSEGHANAIKLEIEKLGISTRGKKLAFMDYVTDVFCQSIIVNHDRPLTPREIHGMIIQKLGFAETKKAVRALEAVEIKETKIAKISNTPQQLTDEEKSIMTRYMMLIFPKSGLTTFEQFKHSKEKTHNNVFSRAISDIPTTATYLI